jgi:cyclase
MTRRFLTAALAAATVLAPAATAAQDRDYTFHEVRPGIHLAVGTGRSSTGANAGIIINEHEVLLVDSHITPAAARSLLRELAALTDKRVRYVVNTHFHFDHAHGNQVYPPDVEIIGHEFTREMLADGQSVRGRGWDRFVTPVAGRVDSLRGELRRATGAADAAKRAELEGAIARGQAYLDALAELRPVAPNSTLATRMTLHRGGREIRILFFGRGHTGGDVVVHLPRERVLITGDLLPEGLPYMGDGFLLEWAETLEQLKALDFDVIMPGHGLPYTDRSRIDKLQGYLRDLWARTAALQAQGVSAADAAARVDMRDHAAHYPTIRGVGADRDAVARIYELLGQRR